MAERRGRRGGEEHQSARLARSYLAVRAEQSAERQPAKERYPMTATVRLPRLDAVQLNSPEAHAQYRLGILARAATRGDAWFTLAERSRPSNKASRG